MSKQIEENSTRSNILKYLEDKPEGSFVNYEDLDNAGSYTSIRSAVVRLCEDKKLVRVAQGVYMIPYPDESIMPDYFEIAKEIGRRAHNIVIPKVLKKTKPAKNNGNTYYYDTDGASRTVKAYDGTLLKFYHKVL